MKVKEFTKFHGTPENALKLLSEDINDFLKKDNSIVVISLSHSIIEFEITEIKFLASALLCYK